MKYFLAPGFDVLTFTKPQPGVYSNLRNRSSSIQQVYYSKMRIFFYGTHLKHYYLAKWLIERGHECLLYLPDRDKPNRLPEWDDPALEGNYPGWLVEVPKRGNRPLKLVEQGLVDAGLLPTRLADYLLARRQSANRTARTMSKPFDVIFTSAREYILPAMTLGPPVVVRSIGSDMSKFPFMFASRYDAALSQLFRKKIRNAAAIIAYQKDTVWASRFLGVYDKLRYFSVPLDVDALSANIDAELRERLKRDYSHYDFVFFLPARKVFSPNNPAYKGPEKVLEALAEFLDKNRNSKVISITRGSDGIEFRKRVDDLNLSGYFEYIEGNIPLYQLTAFMSAENVIVLNDVGFSKAHLTGLSREALSVGAILVDWVEPDSALFRRLYGGACPILVAQDADSVLRQLNHLASLDRRDWQALRKRARDWAIDNLHWKNRIDDLVPILQEAADAPRV